MMPYREALSPMGRFLVSALKARRDATDEELLARQLRALGTDACRAAARRNQIESHVGTSLVEVLGSAAVDKGWRDVVVQNEGRVHDLMTATAAVADALTAAGAVHALVESGGTLLGTDLPASAFCSGDFDMLVEREHFHTAVALAQEQGFELMKRDGRASTARAELRRERDGGNQWLAIGSTPFDRVWVPLSFHVDVGPWLKRAVPSRKVASLFVLHPTDALAFVAIHTSTHSYVRAPGLRLHVDVDRVATDNVIDWARVVTSAGEAAARTRVFVSLSMAAGLLGTEVPARVLADLDPGLRWHALRALLAREGSVADGRPKLPRGKTVALDALLDDRGPLDWAQSVVVPDRSWLEEKFAEPGSNHSTLALHARRLRQLVARWRPV